LSTIDILVLFPLALWYYQSDAVLCGGVEALEKGRNLAEKAAAKKDLSAPCKALVMLAEPVDEYAAYKSSLTLNYIAQNAKAIESAFGWRVRIPVVR
jgi:hypothetical protein